MYVIYFDRKAGGGVGGRGDGGNGWYTVGVEVGSPRQTLRQSRVKVIFRKRLGEQSIGSEQVGQGREGGQERAHGQAKFYRGDSGSHI